MTIRRYLSKASSTVPVGAIRLSPTWLRLAQEEIENCNNVVLNLGNCNIDLSIPSMSLDLIIHVSFL